MNAPPPVAAVGRVVCEGCGQPIDVDRLEALPRTTSCFTCANRTKRPSRGRTCS